MVQREVAHVFVPGVHQQRLRAPAFLLPYAMGAGAIAATLIAWAAFSARPTHTDSPLAAVAAVSLSDVRSVAYTAPSGGRDVGYTRAIDGAGGPRALASFPYALNFHARGEASPTADTLALLTVSDIATLSARLTLVAVRDARRHEIDASFDYLSEIAWSPDGRRLALVHSATPAAFTVSEVNAATRSAVPVARFEDAFLVAPVGYSMDGDRLYMVVIDQSGSTLWVVRNGRAQRAGLLSPGRTRDWVLSPDGARLAFIAVLGSGTPAFAGRTMSIATGAVTSAPGVADQVGAAWHPSTGTARFGGPGGSIKLSTPGEREAYVVPAQWSPDGSTLVAAVYSAPADADGNGTESIEVMTPDYRVRLAEEADARFLGWVLNVE
ncbi:MAG: TolB family protein [Tepidiformaceae bacterium]